MSTLLLHLQFQVSLAFLKTMFQVLFLLLPNHLRHLFKVMQNLCLCVWRCCLSATPTFHKDQIGSLNLDRTGLNWDQWVQDTSPPGSRRSCLRLVILMGCRYEA